MKILKEGRKPELRMYQAKCNTCDCEIQFDESEARLNRQDDGPDYFVVPCPNCRRSIYADVAKPLNPKSWQKI